jgi:hypothetical protein
LEFLDTSIRRAAVAEGGPEWANEYGERAFRVKGQNVDVIYWDVGNTWSGIISVISHNGDERQIVAFWHRLLDIVKAGEED